MYSFIFIAFDYNYSEFFSSWHNCKEEWNESRQKNNIETEKIDINVTQQPSQFHFSD